MPISRFKKTLKTLKHIKDMQIPPLNNKIIEQLTIDDANFI